MKGLIRKKGDSALFLKNRGLSLFIFFILSSFSAFSFLLFFLPAVLWAQEPPPPLLNEEIKRICNQTITNIYDEILKARTRHPELDQFNEQTMYENQYGIYAIAYRRQQSEEKMRKEPYEFAFTLVPIDDLIFKDQGRYGFSVAFPFLGIKFAGYEKMTGGKRQYDILKTVNQQGWLLAEYQQNFLPLQMTLKAHKDSYKTNEPVEFEVELKNTSEHHMLVKEIDETTLYCQLNNKVWGTQTKSSVTAKEVVIKAGGSIQRKFLGEGLKEPGEINLRCSYNMSLKGVKPFHQLKVKIVKP